MMAIPDYSEPSDSENKAFENNETDLSSKQTTPTPNLYQSHAYEHKTPTTVHNINVNYCHSYSIENKNGDKVDIPTLLQSLAHHTTIQSPSPSLKTSNSTIDNSNRLLETKKRSLMMLNLSQPLVFEALDISELLYL